MKISVLAHDSFTGETMELRRVDVDIDEIPPHQPLFDFIVEFMNNEVDAPPVEYVGGTIVTAPGNTSGCMVVKWNAASQPGEESWYPMAVTFWIT